MKKNDRTTLLLTIGCFFAFFLFGFADNIKGPTIPSLLQELHLSYTLGGTLFLGAYIGFFLATLFTGMVADTAGKKSVIYIAGFALLSGISIYALSSGFFLLFLAMFFIGIGLGSLELGCNTIIVDIRRENKGRYLNMLSFFHGLGSMVAPFYAGQLLAAGFSWRHVYGFSLPLAALMLLIFLLLKYPSTPVSRTEKIQWRHFRKRAFTGRMGWFYLLIFTYVAAELAIGSWLVEFLQKTRGQSTQLSSLMLSLFFGTMTLGRFLGSFFVERIGYIRVMAIATVMSILCLSAGIFGPPAINFLLPVSGLFFSIVFPTALAAVSSLHQDNIGIILGIFLAVAGLGGMAGPWIVGLLIDLIGIRVGFGALILFCLISLAALFALSRKRAVVQDLDAQRL